MSLTTKSLTFSYMYTRCSSTFTDSLFPDAPVPLRLTISKYYYVILPVDVEGLGWRRFGTLGIGIIKWRLWLHYTGYCGWVESWWGCRFQTILSSFIFFTHRGKVGWCHALSCAGGEGLGPLTLELLSCDFDCTILDTADEYSLDEVVCFGLFGPVSFLYPQRESWLMPCS